MDCTHKLNCGYRRQAARQPEMLSGSMKVYAREQLFYARELLLAN